MLLSITLLPLMCYFFIVLLSSIFSFRLLTRFCPDGQNHQKAMTHIEHNIKS